MESRLSCKRQALAAAATFASAEVLALAIDLQHTDAAETLGVLDTAFYRNIVLVFVRGLACLLCAGALSVVARRGSVTTPLLASLVLAICGSATALLVSLVNEPTILLTVAPNAGDALAAGASLACMLYAMWPMRRDLALLRSTEGDEARYRLDEEGSDGGLRFGTLRERLAATFRTTDAPVVKTVRWRGREEWRRASWLAGASVVVAVTPPAVLFARIDRQPRAFVVAETPGLRSFSIAGRTLVLNRDGVLSEHRPRRATPRSSSGSSRAPSTSRSPTG